MSERAKIGLALGSGSARGFAHIGVIRVLEAEGIPIDCVAGTSIGALVGAVYAGGALSQGEEFLKTLDRKKITFLLDPLLPVSGLLGGKRLEALLRSFLHHQHIEDFPLPFAAIAADAATGEEVGITTGDAVKAVRASIALPGIFTPVCWNTRILVDGGIVSPVPVHAVRALGADIVIAVNLAGEMTKRSYISTVKDTAQQFDTLEKHRKSEKTVCEELSPKFLKGGIPDFLKQSVEKGKRLVEEHTQVIEEWIDEKVEIGRTVVQEKSSLFAEWLKKDKEQSADLPDIFSILFNSINIMQTEIARSTLRQYPPDVLLTPDLATVRLLDFDKADECIREGERVTRAALPHWWARAG